MICVKLSLIDDTFLVIISDFYCPNQPILHIYIYNLTILFFFFGISTIVRTRSAKLQFRRLASSLRKQTHFDRTMIFRVYSNPCILWQVLHQHVEQLPVITNKEKKRKLRFCGLNFKSDFKNKNLRWWCMRELDAWIFVRCFHKTNTSYSDRQPTLHTTVYRNKTLKALVL